MMSRWRGRLVTWGVVALTGLAPAGCSRKAEQAAPGLAGGDAARGHEAIGRFGCGACHTIPGIEGAQAKVGPSLAGIASRAQLAGRLTNTPDNLVRWICIRRKSTRATRCPNSASATATPATSPPTCTR